VDSRTDRLCNSLHTSEVNYTVIAGHLECHRKKFRKIMHLGMNVFFKSGGIILANINCRSDKRYGKVHKKAGQQGRYAD
jgi:hypothetical protein